MNIEAVRFYSALLHCLNDAFPAREGKLAGVADWLHSVHRTSACFVPLRLVLVAHRA
jgi:hypothetical protein